MLFRSFFFTFYFIDTNNSGVKSIQQNQLSEITDDFDKKNDTISKPDLRSNDTVEINNVSSVVDIAIVDKTPKQDEKPFNIPVSLNNGLLPPPKNDDFLMREDYYVHNSLINSDTTEDTLLETLSFADKRKLKKQEKYNDQLQLMEYRVAVLKVNPAFENQESKNVLSFTHSCWNRFNVNLIGGLVLSQGFLNNDLSRVNPSSRWSAGFGLSYTLNAMVSLDVNVLYQSRGGLSQELLPENGSNNNQSQIAKTLHYLDVPFYINYRIKNRHALRFGIQYSHLLRVDLENPNTSVTSGIRAHDYFATYDMAGIIGYKYLLNERINVGVRANFGLFDVTLGQSAGDDTFDMNRQARFLIEYKLIK